MVARDQTPPRSLTRSRCSMASVRNGKKGRAISGSSAYRGHLSLLKSRLPLLISHLLELSRLTEASPRTTTNLQHLSSRSFISRVPSLGWPNREQPRVTESTCDFCDMSCRISASCWDCQIGLRKRDEEAGIHGVDCSSCAQPGREGWSSVRHGGGENRTISF